MTALGADDHPVDADELAGEVDRADDRLDREEADLRGDREEMLAHLSLKAGETIPALKVQGYATVQCLRGSVELAMDDHSVTMSSGDWLYLDRGQQHAVHSHEDSALLVTIMLGK